MSKKKKGQPVAAATSSPNRPAPAQPVETRPQPAPVHTAPMPVKPAAISEADRPFELIRFDKRVKWFLGICIGLFVVLTLAKINYSSVGMWNQIIPDGSDLKKGVLMGTPRQIRMDDYAGVTPGYISQVLNGFPLENPAIGGERMPIMGWPTVHSSMLFRPYLWGFVLLPLDMGFAWYWNFKVFALLVAGLLFFMLITRNSFWLSVLGASWLLLSSSTQWWMSVGVPEIITIACALFVAAIYWLFSRRTVPIIIGAFGLGYFLFFFVLMFYPPFEVPLAYAILFAGIGYIINERRNDDLRANLLVKGGAILGSLAMIGFAGYLFYEDAQSTLNIITNTAYPGKRSELGGTGFIANLFSEYYNWLITDKAMPASWLNVCEQSQSLVFAPVIAMSMVYTYIKTRRVDFIQAGLLVFIVLAFIWINFGFPEWLGKLTLMSMSPPRRTQVPFGIANVMLAVAYVGSMRNQTIRGGAIPTLLMGAAVLALMIYAAVLNVNDSDGFFKTYQLVLPTLFFVVLNAVLLPQVNAPVRNWVFGLGIFVFLLNNLTVNPVSVGLSPLTDNALYKEIKKAQETDPKARWLVNGSQYIGYMAQATGVNVLGGVKQTPDFKTMRVLDPTSQRDTVYNRYAHTTFYSYINGRDTVIMNNQFYDGYNVGLDPCSPKLKQLNVRFVIFDHQPQAPEIRCMKQVSSLGSISIYRIND